jgi:hypothetical protein
MHPVYFFLNSPSVIEHILNWNVRQGWKNLYIVGILSHKDSCFLVRFSSNISCMLPHRLSLLWLDGKKKITLHQWGTQQDNSATKHAVI